MTPEDELAEAKAMAKKVGYGSGSLASVIENLAELSATARRALDDLVKMRNVCRNPNHAMPDGTPYPHEIGPSCMAESAAPEAEQNAMLRDPAEILGNASLYLGDTYPFIKCDAHRQTPERRAAEILCALKDVIELSDWSVTW